MLQDILNSIKGAAGSRRETQLEAVEVVLSSWMLRDSFEICTELDDEGMHFVFGVQVGDQRIGTKIATFPYSHRSVAGAGGVHEKTHKLCINAHELDHKIIAIIHSHPGAGFWANFPSCIDKATHKKWELTAPIIGGIWSRDGYIRFFSHRQPFYIRIVGDGLKWISSNVYLLEGLKKERRDEFS